MQENEKGRKSSRRVVIMGAAGRDFHNFNTVFRDNPDYEVVAFTATQIPNISGKKYPASLAGSAYPNGIPIVPEDELTRLVREQNVDVVVFSYSDVSHEEVMHKASLALACGADFQLLGPRSTMLKSSKRVVSVCAVRTGCGKSPTSRKIAKTLREQGWKVAVVRHPMPYGNLERQVWQRFSSLEDFKKHECTIEEMEEYEPHIVNGVTVFSGIDYRKIFTEAEKEADVIVWDGGNNDMPFVWPDIDIVVTDPHRPNHELRYFPGEPNFLRAGIIVITKLDSAKPENVKILEENIRKHNPRATVVRANLAITVEDETKIRGKKVLVVEDGPTLTHGEMTFGAGVIAARKYQAAELVDPRPFASGDIKRTLESYPDLRGLLPAMGYGQAQIRDLEDTINRTPCDTVLIATPIDLRRICNIWHDTCRVFYELDEIGSPSLRDILARLKVS